MLREDERVFTSNKKGVIETPLAVCLRGRDLNRVPSHSGDPRLRSKLIQASWSAIRQGGELREFFRTVARKHPRHLGPRVAIVAVAHKLCVRASGS